MTDLLVNGRVPSDPAHVLPINDRGLSYGDGLFETALLKDGEVRFLDDHLGRLSLGCERLLIPMPGLELLREEIARVCSPHRDGVLKIIVTRGAGGRGYRPEAQLVPTRIVALHPRPVISPEPVMVRWCETRLGRNTRLAGIKHLNRLEQVLAQQEWDDPRIAEGFMLDTEGELVCATSCNVFLVRDGVLRTPDLRFCGVAGVMRARVILAAAELGIAVVEEPLWPDDVATAQEVFITNAVRGIRAVVSLDTLSWSPGPITAQLAAQLRL